MALFLTERNIRSKPFIKKRMFKCMIPGSINSNDRNWMTATYISTKLENGFNVGVCDAQALLYVIRPFTEGLFQTTFYHRINRDYAFVFKIEIRTEEEFVRVGEFYFRANRNPFEPKMEGLELNRDLSPYLEQPYKILVTTSFFNINPPVPHFLEPGNDEESGPPKPLEKTFKFDQCVICLDRKPDVMFINCNHMCVCNECEKTHPSTKCPYCRAKVSRKLLI